MPNCDPLDGFFYPTLTLLTNSYSSATSWCQMAILGTDFSILFSHSLYILIFSLSQWDDWKTRKNRKNCITKPRLKSPNKGSNNKKITSNKRTTPLDRVWKCSGSVVECLTLDLGVEGLSLTGATELSPWARHINLCLVIVQPRKTHPDLTEKLLTGT